MKHRIIICHGVNVRSPQYAASLVANLKPLLKDIDHDIQALYLGDIFQQDLNIVQEQQKKSPLSPLLRATAERAFMADFVGDQYQFDNWREELLSQVEAIKSDGPVHVIAHSWGCVFAVEDLLPVINAVSLTMHGCPLDLYRLRTGLDRYEFAVPTDNFFHPMDFIGGPISQSSNAIDHVITDAGPNVDFDLIDELQSFLDVHKSHSSGWDSLTMAQCIAKKVITVQQHLEVQNVAGFSKPAKVQNSGRSS